MKFSTLNLLFLIFFSSLLFSCDKNDIDPNNGGIVTDIDGNKYHTVTIGFQVWMVENLKTTRFRNGDPIPYINQLPKYGYGGYGYEVETTAGYCNYDDNDEIASKYGRLYNWFAVKDEREIAPEGWHIPTKDEWEELAAYAQANTQPNSSVAKDLAAKTDWVISTLPGTIGNDLSLNNSTGFTALPGGMLIINEYEGLRATTNWWCSDDSFDVIGDDVIPAAYYFRMDFGEYDYSRELKRRITTLDYSLSVRCLKD
ncbi:fibrobacter succinogenes major paralogous domain-containing protein [Draconibacterium sp. IB214405]|uniref:fibrobacter succinogenes major paralogous domain-containing protein n=1 Tax=Draconibacterium sp. IB214405 TaxID=3097352 RepID=UPI002A13898C|nr:fibrobacter succinogenes major paralogous domain-containing protein [Draconibacterium sp. IB214405]MDX8338444.1 fibrobacter succinogenes major paralogous domain-containing protein [Draconibacterium sp. IB214405]